jgi:hypothetical protein
MKVVYLYVYNYWKYLCVRMHMLRLRTELEGGTEASRKPGCH